MSIITALKNHELQCTTAEYHAHEALSCSQFLSAGLYTDTEEFWTPHLFGQKIQSTEAMDIGTLVHAAMYEPEKFHELFAVRPLTAKGALVANNTHEFAAWAAAHQGKIHISPKDLPDINGMADALHRAEEAGCLKGYRRVTRRIACEQSYIARHPETGLWLRIKPDDLRVHVRNGQLCCDDLKTSDDVSPGKFRRSCDKFGYWRRAAWYRSVLRLITGEDCIFRMIVVQSSAPYLVALYQVSEEKLDECERQNDASLTALAHCIDKTGDFRPAWLKGAYYL